MRMTTARCDHCKKQSSLREFRPGEHTQGAELYWQQGWYHLTKRVALGEDREWDFCSLECLGAWVPVNAETEKEVALLEYRSKAIESGWIH